MKHLVFFIIFQIVILLSNSLIAQNMNLPAPPCMPSYRSLVYSNWYQMNTLPLTSDMPLDVMASYIVGDSIQKTVSVAWLDGFFKRRTWDDSLKRAIRYDYTMNDYDPVRFFYYGRTGSLSIYQMARDYLHNKILGDVLALSPKPYLDYMLTSSGIIAYVKTEEVTNAYDPYAGWAKSGKVLTTSIIDPIKGKLIPDCINTNPPAKPQPNTLLTSTNKHIASIGSCLQFKYVSEWFRTGINSDGTYLTDTTLEAHKNKEYVVFLDVIDLCHENYYNYYSIFPRKQSDRFRSVAMFPVQNGMVTHIEDFGYGSTLSVTEFIARLRARINEMKNY
ncbi:MAG: hypothetical protein IPP08_03430 [Chlorobiota bacterium]|nr:hypothetical protein [Chlorobiota bacterium]QQS67236.1 MAG: hypothetical protein IPP08_03430 [Chlorobiota bacterium]